MEGNLDLEALIKEILSKHGYTFTLRPQQMEIITSLVKGKHTIGILPTGAGKSITYTLLPLLLDEIDPDNAPHISLIVCPLRSLIFDQVARARAKNIQCVGITRSEEMTNEDKASLQAGTVSLIYTSPEALISGPWLKYFRTYVRHFCLVTLDELHCLSTWGGDFRPLYLRMAELRSRFTSVPVLGLSATVDAKVLEDVLKILELSKDQVNIIASLPDRPNIFLRVNHQAKYVMEKDLEWVVVGLQKQREKYPKTLIFSNTVSQVYEIFAFIKTSLGSEAYVGEKSHKNRLVSMYHSDIGEKLQHFTQATFPREDTAMRVLVTTIAFGMGVEVPDVRQVVHWGRVTSVLGFWQEIGRAGRNRSKAESIWYPQSVGGEGKDTLEKIKNKKEVCVRTTILGHFVLPGMGEPLRAYTERQPCTKQCDTCACALCSCCSHCQARCGCSK